MFQNIIGQQNDQIASPASQNQTSNIEIVKNFGRLQSMLARENATVTEAYAFFEETIYPQLCDAGGSTPTIVQGQLSTLLFPKLADEITARSFPADLPTVSRVSELMMELGVVRWATWGDLVIALAECICRISTTPGDYPSTQAYETTMARRDALLDDLVGAWRAFDPPASNTPESAETPSIERTDATAPIPITDGIKPMVNQSEETKPSLVEAFAGMFPQYPPYSLVRPSWAALSTYALLANLKNHNQSLREKAHPFIEMMRQQLAKSQAPIVPQRPHVPVFNKCPQYLNSLVRHFLKCLRNNKETEWRPLSVPKGVTSRSLGETIYKEVGHAIRSRNLESVEASWRKLWGEEAEPSKARLQQLREMGETFNFFIFAFMSMRQTRRSLDVWNCMVKHEIPVTVKTWTSMIQGCTQARNSHGINTIWRRLVASGTKLDTPIWTARIAGLIMSGDLQGGIAALDEMATIWRERDKPKNAAIAVKPSVEPINAALIWLLRLDQLPVVMKMLLWAAQQGIEPDIYTFNTMLRPMVREGRPDKVHEILDMMKRLNVNADGATFTILLDGALAGISAMTAKEQIEKVNQVIREIEVVGFKANMQTWGKMIYILLEEGGPNSDGAAVNTVLAHIWNRGSELSSHIYTMLAQHYFSRDPPDAAAVTALINNRKLRTNRSIDRVFWERVMKGYCQVGETQRALEIFSNLASAGSLMTFSTMYELLLAVLEAGKEGEAKKLVEVAKGLTLNDTEAVGEGGQVGERGPRYWRHRFWHLAEQRGLMEKDVRETFHAAAARS